MLLNALINYDSFDKMSLEKVKCKGSVSHFIAQKVTEALPEVYDVLGVDRRVQILAQQRVVTLVKTSLETVRHISLDDLDQS